MHERGRALPIAPRPIERRHFHFVPLVCERFTEQDDRARDSAGAQVEGLRDLKNLHGSDDEAGAAFEVSVIGGKRLERSRRNTSIELIGFDERLVQK